MGTPAVVTLDIFPPVTQWNPKKPKKNLLAISFDNWKKKLLFQVSAFLEVSNFGVNYLTAA